MRPRVKKVNAIENYILLLEFENGADICPDELYNNSYNVN